MKALLRRLTPRTLSSRLVVVAALSLLLAQLISFALLTREYGRQWVTLTAAPAALRIIEAVEDPGHAQRERRRERVTVGTTPPPQGEGRAEPAIAARASELLANSGIPVRQVVAYIDRRAPPAPPRYARLIDPHEMRGNRPDIGRLRLSVQLGDGRWLTATSRARKGAPVITRFLLTQTLLIYAAVLIPLLLIGRRLSKPLGTLTEAARDFSPDRPQPPLPERGPEDIRDLTHAFNDMHRRIDAMLAEKDHMLGAIGHDLRTPLASLRVRVESVEDEEERVHMVATIEDMRQMLDDILALARAGRERQPPQRLDLGALAEAVVDDFRAMGADVELVEAERTVVSVHAPALRRAVRNLIDNAVKYGERARLTVGTAGGAALLTVEDDGPGIDPTRIDDMLEPFTRLEGSRNRDTGGAGLGLALVRAVMRAEGGEVRLANRVGGHGLRAELVLPVAN